MWVIPKSLSSACAPELPDSTKASDWPFRAAEQSFMWSTKRLASPYWYRLWKLGGWPRLLVSRMSPDSMAVPFVARLASSLPDFHVSRSPLPAAGTARKTSGTSSRTSLALLKKYSPVAYFLRTCPASLQLGLFTTEAKSSATSRPLTVRSKKSRILDRVGTLSLRETGYTGDYSANTGSPHCSMSAANWSDWATALVAECSARKNWVPANSESGSSSLPWPTAAAHDAKGNRGSQNTFTDGHYRPHDLSTSTEKWPTPVARDDNKTPEAHLAMKQRMGERDGTHANRMAITSLNVKVQAWATPRSTVKGPNTGKRGTGGPDLYEQTQKLWGSPRAAEFKGSGPVGSSRHAHRLKRHYLDAQVETFTHTGLQGQEMPNDGTVSSETSPASPPLWPTPNCQPDAGPNNHYRGDPKAGRQLTEEARNWPTPSVSMMTPEDQAQAMFAGNDRRRPSYRNANWQTPRSHEVGGFNQQKSGEQTLSLTGQAIGGRTEQQMRRKLNPNFVSWLMGMPPGWPTIYPERSDYEPWVARSSQVVRQWLSLYWRHVLARGR